MANWDEVDEALADYTVSCNTNERLRKMQRDWTRMLHFVCNDTSDTFSMDVRAGEIVSTGQGPRDRLVDEPFKRWNPVGRFPSDRGTHAFGSVHRRVLRI